MREFRDSKGRSWKLVVDVESAERVRDVLKVDIFKLADEHSHVFNDVVLFVNLLFVLCKDQCDAVSVTDRDFGKAINGDVLDDASRKLLEEVADFFPELRRKILRKQIEKGAELAQAATERAIAEIDRLSVDQILDGLRSMRSPAA